MTTLPRISLALVLLLTASAAASTDSSKLPVGDKKYSSTAAVQGSIYTCQSNYNGGGAFQKGPWFNSDGTTFNFTTKATVDGRNPASSATASFKLSSSKRTRTIASNSLPVNGFTGTFPVSASDDAALYDRNPNTIKAGSISVSLPANPTKASKPGCVRDVGVALNGVSILNALDAAGRDALAWEVQDDCQGHPNNNSYHYHAVPTCLTSYSSGKSHSALVGYAYDGFGIYGPRGEDGAALENSDLDACHGHTHKLKWDGKTKSIYHYHATREYPYTVGCFRGTSQQPQPTGPPGAGGP